MRTSFPVAAPAAAWEAIADPVRLAAMLPGCRSVTRSTDGQGTLHVVAEVAVASVRGLWAGTVEPVDPDAVRVTGSGAPGAVDLLVRADPQRTTVTVEGTVDGALGTVGTAVLAAAVRRLAEDLLAAAAAPPVAPRSSAADVGPPGDRAMPPPPLSGVPDADPAWDPSPTTVVRHRRSGVLAVVAAAVVTVVLARRRRSR